MANKNSHIDSLEIQDLHSFGQCLDNPAMLLSGAENKEVLEKMLTHIVATEFTNDLVGKAKHIKYRLRNEAGYHLSEELKNNILDFTETKDFQNLKKYVLACIESHNH
ncbi:uncharacterized protein LOC118458798 [Anopheles albimanus]|uniref:uncharacterized protein LOC118458798 n=1 Tax=Anopheles albimanus TaxID=7167 RepID=UPI001641976A|nr:uncharacterized protein LOC118458798 [Anopheles albimanus]